MAENGARTSRILWDRIAAGVLGALVSLAVVGAYALDTSRLDWMAGDNAQHYVGWDFFRHQPWQLPLGHITGYPVHTGSSLVFTDSLPIVALPLRLLAGILPSPFQFHGWWLLACYVLQAVFAVVLLDMLGVRAPLTRVFGAVLFVLAPWFSGHISIMGQWQLLAALACYAADVRDNRMRIGRWTALCVLALFTHFYLWWMIATVAAAAAARHAWQTRRWQSFARDAAIILGASALTLLALGYFGCEDPAGAGFGVYSTNLDSFFDSTGYSRWLPGLPHSAGQFEGFAYFGVAGLILLAAAVVIHVRSPRSARAQWLPLWIALIYLYALAVSTTVTFGSHVILQLPRGGGLFFGTIRSAGRFVFLVCDALLAFAVLTLAKRFPRAAPGVLALAIATQCYELAPWYAVHRAGPSGSFPPLTDPVWQSVPRDYDHIDIYPPLLVPTRCIDWIADGDEAAVGLYPFSQLAADHAMTINSAYLARRDKVAERSYCASFIAEVDSGIIEPRTFYVLDPRFRDRFLAHMPADCGHLDGKEICTAKTDTTALHAALK